MSRRPDELPPRLALGMATVMILAALATFGVVALLMWWLV